jgi:hypothetical protein
MLIPRNYIAYFSLTVQWTFDPDRLKAICYGTGLAIPLVLAVGSAMPGLLRQKIDHAQE